MKEIIIIVLIAFIPLIFIIVNINNRIKKSNPINAYKDSSKEFDKLYNKLYNLNIKIIKKYNNPFKKMILLKLLSILIILLFLIFINSTFAKYLIVPFIISVIVLLTPFNFKDQILKNQLLYITSFKNAIINSFIKLLNKNLTYIPEGKENTELEEKYSNAHFDDIEYSRFCADDYLEGYLDDSVFVKLSDITLLSVYLKGDKEETAKLFQGIFAYTNSTKDIDTYIKICKKHYFSFKNIEKNNKVELDNSEFEKYFDVYSENSILAVRLLTADIMDVFIDFYKKFNITFEVVFKNNIIYLRFFTGPMFEPKLLGNIMDKQFLYEYYCILDFILDVTKKVNAILDELEI